MVAQPAHGAPDLGERFALGEMLGQGSFGRVYRATDRRYGIDVALKVLSGFHSEALRLFKAEFRALAHVSHPNLVALYELHSHGEAWFYTMEHIPGVTLSRWVKSEPRSVEAVRDALLQMASGIAALHEAGLLHRDLKPSNVLCTPEGRVVVGDFGHIGTLDKARGATDDRVIGTVAYSAPEVWLRTPIGPAADWYAFGITMFQLLTGRLPFDGVAARIEADGPLPSQLVPTIPADLDALTARLLRRSPGERPNPDECLAILAGKEPPRAIWTSRAAPFLGRAEPLLAIGQALDATRTHASALHLALGPSGIGKTSLVDEVARRAAGKGALVLRGRCHPQDALLARGLDDVVDGLGRYVARCAAPRRAKLVPNAEPELGRMFPTLSDVLPETLQRGARASGKEERQAALSALARILGRVAEITPVLVVIDDLHWADEATGSALVSLLDGLRAAPGLLLLGTARDDHAEGSACLALLRRAVPDATVHVLGPLDDADARAIVRSVLGDEDGARVHAVLEAAQGNAYLLHELSSHLRQESVPPPGTTEDALVDRVVSSRLSRLSPSARRMLEVLTLAEIPVPTDVAIDAASLLESDYLGNMTTLRAGRLVSPRLAQGRESLEPYHGRVREAVLRSIPAPARPALHASLARAFVRSEAPREVIARHYFSAGEMVLALEHARAAATEARESLAFGRAIAMLELSLRTDAASAEERVDIESELSDALANAGRGPEAAAAFLRLATLDPTHAHVHERRAAEQLLFSGHLTEGLDVLGRVLGRVGLSLPRSRAISIARVMWAQLFGPGRRVLEEPFVLGAAPDPTLFPRIDACNAATLGLTMADPLASAVMQAQHLEDALRANEPERLARALGIHMVHTAGGRYDPERTRKIGQRCDELLRGEPAPQTVAEISLARAGAAWMEGRYAACLSDADAAMALLRRSSCVGMHWHLDTHHVMELEVLEAMGRWDEMRERLGPYLWDARERGDRFLESSLRSRFRPTLLLAEDAPDAAREEVTLARRIWGQSEFDLVALYGAIRESACDLYAGRYERAMAKMEATWSEMQRSLLVRVVFYRDMGAFARAVALLGWARSVGASERARTLRDVRAIEAELRATTSPVPVAHAALLAATLSSIEERPEARAAYGAAAEGFDALGATLLAAACRWRAAGPGAAPLAPRGAKLARPERVLAMLAP